MRSESAKYHLPVRCSQRLYCAGFSRIGGTYGQADTLFYSNNRAEWASLILYNDLSGHLADYPGALKKDKMDNDFESYHLLMVQFADGSFHNEKRYFQFFYSTYLPPE